MPSGLELLMAHKDEPKASVLQSKVEKMERMPWIEKYRPKNLDDIASQSTTVQILKKNLETSNLPHMLFYGPPGTGKTSTILAMARQLYGPSLFKSRVLELNASDERGISIVRERIKDFARLAVSNPSESDLASHPCPPYKLVILDEADSMTGDAQSALRRTMETYSGITRFCLICNYVTRIIDPLASRCSKFRFKSLDEDSAFARLKYICDEESIKVDDDTLREILRISQGDLRRAINYLQSVSKLLTEEKDDNGDVIMADDGQATKQEEVRELFGFMPSSLLSQFLSVLEAKDLNAIFEFLQEKIAKKGYNASTLLNSLHDRLLLGDRDGDQVDISLRLSNRQKNQIAMTLFDADNKLTQGCDECIQLLNCAIEISKEL
ncbi:DEKNAAC103111 [Brettanomyces naardenensis]|uniref:DEKNAAC103112 n=1 Tax=Brettanomyces naardenensis TaxID=13370 RepID=A0A448YMN3_BRENA|nr:DEKNAAC103111 [Brettanomyces naardenensis]